jgi:hypothetical protein
MKSEYPYTPKQAEKQPQMIAPASRLTDEKISDESGTETVADSALKPAGLNNPFWNESPKRRFVARRDSRRYFSALDLPVGSATHCAGLAGREADEWQSPAPTFFPAQDEAANHGRVPV